MTKPQTYVARHEDVRGPSLSAIDAESKTPVVENDDPFHDPIIGWVTLALVLSFLAVWSWYFAIYLGVEYGTPPWSANSFPPPLVK